MTELLRLRCYLSDLPPQCWNAAELEEALRCYAGDFVWCCQAIRAAVTGSLASPPIFRVMEIIGREEVLGRIWDALTVDEQLMLRGNRENLWAVPLDERRRLVQLVGSGE